MGNGSFIENIKRIINRGQSRSIIVTGNVYDLFGRTFDPLLEHLSKECKVDPTPNQKGITQLIYRLNNPVECRGDFDEASRIWQHNTNNKSLEDRFAESNRNATFALELLRQVTECYRKAKARSDNNLLIMIEAADLLIPENEINRMSLSDRQRVAIVHDWFSDPEFINGGDTVILLAESRSQIHHRIARLPQVVSVDIPLPDKETRSRFIRYHLDQLPTKPTISHPDVPELTAGLSIHAIRQLLLSGECSAEAIADKVEDYMISQLGEGVVEFKRPSHSLKDVIGFTRVKDFMQKELIPGFKKGNLSGAAVGGPIGGGKTFICEAVAAELGIPVIVLKNIRSKWYGETDQIFERLKRLLETFNRSVIFVDEADAQFGSIDDGHATERRLTGKIQAMMSDVTLKGRVIWFLMTARIHRLSPDIRRPGRMDLIIPILDPEGDDRKEFIKWVAGVLPEDTGQSHVEELEQIIPNSASAAMFAMIRSRIKQCQSIEDAMFAINDMVTPDISETRQYQTLQAKLNCTRKSLIFTPEQVETMSKKGMLTYDSERDKWREKIRELESRGFN